MRVLLSTIGSRGDVQPLVALASQLREKGGQVRLCVPPDFREWIEGLGFEVTPIGPEVRPAAAARPSAPPSAEERRQLVEAMVAGQFETLSAAARGCDVIVGATALQIAARSVAEKLGIGYVFVAYSPTVLPSPHHAPPLLPMREAPAAGGDNRELWARDSERFNTTFGAALNAQRAAVGLAPVADVRAHMFTDRPWLAADAALAPWPGTGDGVFQTGAWILPDERPLPPELEAFLAGGAPPVYFGFGSTRAPGDLAAVMVETARALGRRSVVSRGWADLSPGDARDSIAIGEVNLLRLFRRVAAVVHHGGAGTTTAAALAGVPQVVLPQIYDQHYWAGRVEDLGIGARSTAESAGLGSALERALRPEATARAQAFAGSVRSDGARLAAERLIRGGR